MRWQSRLRRAVLVLAGALAAIAAIFSLPGLRQLVRRTPQLQTQTPSRTDVRDELASVYRDIERPSPPAARQVFVESPISGGIAAALASGVWWLRAHPEAHHALFGRLVNECELQIALERATRLAVSRGMTAIDQDDAPSFLAVERATASTLDAAKRASFGADGTAVDSEPAVDAPTIDSALDQASLRAHSVELAVRGRVPTGWATNSGLYAINVALWAVLQSSPDRANDVSAFLLRVMPFWWQTRGPVDRRDLGSDTGGPRFLHPEFWIVSARPAALHRDDRQRLHREGGPAVAWRDGWSLSYLRGIHVAPRLAVGEFTIGDIHATRNVELRRLLVEIYERGAPGRYIRDAGAQVIDSDVDALGHMRRLLRVDQPGDEPYVAVEVTNSTMEPEGFHRCYTLRVPPTMDTCRDAVAWTFGLAPDDYAPEFET
jgi:hypothetical protein